MKYAVTRSRAASFWGVNYIWSAVLPGNFDSSAALAPGERGACHVFAWCHQPLRRW